MEYFIIGIIFICLAIVIILQDRNKETLKQENDSLQNKLMGQKDAFRHEARLRSNLYHTIEGLREELQRAINKSVEEKMRSVVVSVKENYSFLELTKIQGDMDKHIKYRLRKELVEKLLQNNDYFEFRRTWDDYGMKMTAETRLKIIKPENHEANKV